MPPIKISDIRKAKEEVEGLAAAFEAVSDAQAGLGELPPTGTAGNWPGAGAAAPGLVDPAGRPLSKGGVTTINPAIPANPSNVGVPWFVSNPSTINPVIPANPSFVGPSWAPGAPGGAGAGGGGGHLGPAFGPTHGVRRAGTKPSEVVLTSLDGTLSIGLDAILFYMREGTASITGYQPSGANFPIEVYDLTRALNSASALFPLNQGKSTGRKGLGTSASGAGGSASGGSGGRTPLRREPTPPTSSGSGGQVPFQQSPPQAGGKARSSGASGDIIVEVKPPRQPTRGEALILSELEKQTQALVRINRTQAQDDGGLQFRRVKL
jgi:hypothetical protein